MLTPEECALAEAISDRLLELYVQRDEACREVRHLQHKIEETAAERNELLASARED